MLIAKERKGLGWLFILRILEILDRLLQAILELLVTFNDLIRLQIVEAITQVGSPIP